MLATIPVPFFFSNGKYNISLGKDHYFLRGGKGVGGWAITKKSSCTTKTAGKRIVQGEP